MKTETAPAGVAVDAQVRLMQEMLRALEIAADFCGTITAEECHCSVAIPINDAISKARWYLQRPNGEPVRPCAPETNHE